MNALFFYFLFIFVYFKKVTLNNDLNDLNGSLDNVKVVNVKLNDDIKNIRREIKFLRRLYTETSISSPFPSVSTNNLDEESSAQMSFEDGSEKWMQDELELARADVSREYEEFSNEQLRDHEAKLEDELMLELERLEGEYSKREAALEHESDEILDELIELNAQLADDFSEFESLTRINSELNDRLIHLSSCLIEFNSMSKEKQERMMVNYSIVSLKKENGNLL